MKKNLLFCFCVILAIVLLSLGAFIRFRQIEKAPDTLQNIPDDTPTIEKKIIAIVSKNTNDNQENPKYSLIAIPNIGNPITLMDYNIKDLSIVYTYHQNKLYLYVQDATNNDVNMLGFIDLNLEGNSYPFIELAKVQANGLPHSIAVVDDIIYYTSSASKHIIYQYDMITKEITEKEIFDTNVGGITLYSLENHQLAYQVSSYGNVPPVIGIMNTKTNEKHEITDGTIDFVYDNKIIYKQYEYNNYDTWTYFEYDTKNEQKKKISDAITRTVVADGISHIIPVDDGYIYVNDDTIYHYRENHIEKLYQFDSLINQITIAPNNKIYLLHGYGPHYIPHYFVLNLKTLEKKELETYEFYYHVLYLK